MLWAAALAVAACRAAAPVDDSLLTRQPCAPPCWQGLTPGQSTVDDARDVLDQNPLVAGNWGGGITSDIGFTLYWWWAGKSRDVARRNALQFDTAGVLQRISLQPNRAVTIGQLVETCGPPEIVTLTAHVPDAFVFQPHGVFVVAVWARYSLMVEWFQRADVFSKPLVHCPSVDGQITQVTYYRGDRAQQIIEEYTVSSPQPWSVVVGGETVFEETKDGVTNHCVEIPK